MFSSLNENGKVVQDQYKIKPLKCTRCQENINPSSNFCRKCALPISTTEQYCNEVNLIQQNKNLQNRLNSVEDEISKLTEIIKIIQQNPILSQIKVEVLSKRKFQS